VVVAWLFISVEFLSDEDAAGFGRYRGPPSQDDLDRLFFRDDADRVLVSKRRGDHMRLGFASQLVTVRYLGSFLVDEPWMCPTWWWSTWPTSSELTTRRV